MDDLETFITGYIFKIILAVLSFILTLVFVFLAKKLPLCCADPKICTRILLALATGSIIGASFLHLLPEAEESFDRYYDHDEHFPFAHLVTCIVFLFCLMIDSISDHHQQTLPGYQYENILDAHDHIPHVPHDHASGGCHFINENSTIVLFLIAIGAHSFFEGLGIGAANDPDEVVTVVVAVFAHKFLEAIGVGIFLLGHMATLNVAFVICSVLYSVATPAGICIGLIGESSDIAAAVLLSCATGSLLYVGLWEMLAQSLLISKRLKEKLIVYCFIIIGFLPLLMASIIERMSDHHHH